MTQAPATGGETSQAPATGGETSQAPATGGETSHAPGTGGETSHAPGTGGAVRLRHQTPADLPVHRVLTFWFQQAGPEDWFSGSAAFDARCRMLQPAAEAAIAGRYTGQAVDPRSALALILLTDQLPRNLWRDTPAAFSGDLVALTAARRMLGQGWDEALGRPAERLFCYLPFEHSEHLEDQDLAVTLIAVLGDADWSDDAERHRDQIRRFGRFPHRNAILGRVSTPDEAAFVAAGKAGF